MKKTLLVIAIAVVGGVLTQAVGKPGLESAGFPAAGTASIAWPQAVRLLEGCQVSMAAQTHGLQVYLRLKDNSKVVAVEPVIDEVFSVVNRTKPTCGDFPIATE